MALQAVRSMSSEASRSRHVAVWVGWLSILTGILCIPLLFLGSGSLKIIGVLFLSIITQLGTGATALFAAWAARDTDKLTGDS